jgi:hypothetical protein
VSASSVNPRALAEFLQAPAGRQALPIGLIEELVDRPGIGRLAEMQIRDHRGPGIDIRRQEAGALNQGVDQRALAGLDLPDHRDPAGETLSVLHQFVQGERVIEHRPKLGRQPIGVRRDLPQFLTQLISSVRLGTLVINAKHSPALGTRLKYIISQQSESRQRALVSTHCAPPVSIPVISRYIIVILSP